MTTQNKGRLKVGIVGAGKMGGYHLQKFQALDSATVAGFVEPDEARAREVSTRFGVAAFASLPELFFESDAVVVAAPTATHARVVAQALEAGLHVLCEKPLTDNVDSARALEALAKEKGLVLQVGMVERFRLAAMAGKLSLDPVFFVETHRLSPGLPRESGVDVISDLMIHDIDLVLSLIGEAPTKVAAFGAKVVTPQTDLANVRLEFPSGAVASLNASRVSDESVRKLRVFSGGGYTHFDFNANKVATTPSRGRKTDYQFEGLDPLADQAWHFVESARTGGRPAVTAADGVKALEWVKAIQDQVNRGQHANPALAGLPGHSTGGGRSG